MWDSYEPLSRNGVLTVQDDVNLLAGDIIRNPDTTDSYLLHSVHEETSLCTMYSYVDDEFYEWSFDDVRSRRKEDDWLLRLLGLNVKFTVPKDDGGQVGVLFHGSAMQTETLIDIMGGNEHFAPCLGWVLQEGVKGYEITEPFELSNSATHPDWNEFYELYIETFSEDFSRFSLSETELNRLRKGVLDVFIHNINKRITVPENYAVSLSEDDVLTVNEGVAYIFDDSHSDGFEFYG